jgi:succinate dehydrogenase / fumarate reductase flavoprotein subunit
MWDYVGMGRNEQGLKTAIEKIKHLKDEFWKNVRIPGSKDDINLELEKAMRLADFIELGELMARDALLREESCGGHFREEYQTTDGETLRNDDKFKFVSVWEFKGDEKEPEMHKEELIYEETEVKVRNYK